MNGNGASVKMRRRVRYIVEKYLLFILLIFNELQNTKTSGYLRPQYFNIRIFNSTRGCLPEDVLQYSPLVVKDPKYEQLKIKADELGWRKYPDIVFIIRYAFKVLKVQGQQYVAFLF